MPKLELGDLEAVRRDKEFNIPKLAGLVDQGFDLTALVPSCVLMFKQELPLMFPEDAEVQKVKAAFFDPFEYLMLRHREGKLKTDFKTGLGKVAYHVACHQRVQNIGPKTKEALSLIPGTTARGHRALLGPRRNLRGQGGAAGVCDEDRQAGGRRASTRRSPIIRLRLRDGGPSYRSGARGGRARASISLLRKAYGV